MAKQTLGEVNIMIQNLDEKVDTIKSDLKGDMKAMESRIISAIKEQNRTNKEIYAKREDVKMLKIIGTAVVSVVTALVIFVIEQAFTRSFK